MRDEHVVARLGLDFPAKQMSVSEGRGELIVATLEDSTISVCDLRTLARVRQSRLDHLPEHMQLDPTGEVPAVGNYYEDAVTLLRLEDMSLRRVAGLSAPHNLVFIDAGRRLLVANLAADIVTVIDVARARIESEIAIPRTTGEDAGITDIHLAADGRRAWAVPVSGVLPAWFDSRALVLSRHSHAAHVVDLDAAAPLATIPLPGTPEAGLVTADGSKAFVALGDADAVAVIDTRTLGPPRIIGHVVLEPVRMTMVGGRNICD